MDGQLTAVHIIGFVAEQIEKLGVDHRDQEVECTVGITHNQEQCRFPVAQLVQFQFIVHGGIPNFLNVEGRKPGTAGNKDGLGRFAPCCFYFLVYYTLSCRISIAGFCKLVKWKQLAAQGVPGRQVHKGVAGAASAGEV